MRRRSRLLLLAAAAGVLAVAAAPAAVGHLLRRWEDNPVLRGGRLATREGCLHCHLPPGGGEIPNPGSRWGTVPRFGAGNALMYVDDLADVEGFVRHGAPRAWLDDPDVRERLAAQRIRMPAYGDVLGDAAIADLVAWTAATEGVGLPADPAVAAGRALARRHGCLACHGPEGAGGLPNPGALGGFVPGFLGRNFRDLVHDRDELAEWVRTGTLRRLATNPVATWAWRRQRLAMPAYGEALTDQDLDHLWAWIQATRRHFGVDG